MGKRLDERGGAAALFGRQRVVGRRWGGPFFVKVLDLLLVHLGHHRPLQLHCGTCGAREDIRWLKLSWCWDRDPSSARCVSAPLTQLSSCDGEIPPQNGPFLNALSVGCCLLVDCVDPLLNGCVDDPVSGVGDLRDACGFAAQFPTELNDVWRQLVLRIA